MPDEPEPVSRPGIALGVDGYHGGWVGSYLCTPSGLATQPGLCVIHSATFPELIDRCDQVVAVIGVDIPLWLPESTPRRAELEAKRALGRRSATLFITPVRAALEAETYQEALQINRAITGAGFSKQAYGLRSKIFEVRRWSACSHADIREVHPELSFAQLNGGNALNASKKTWNGVQQRLELLAQQGIVVPADLGAAGVVPVDDVVDSAVALWTALRIQAGTAVSLPSSPQPDEIAIWS